MDVALNLLLTAIINNYFKDEYCIYYLSTHKEIQIENVPVINYDSSDITKLHFQHCCQLLIIYDDKPGLVMEQLEEKYKYENNTKGHNDRKYLILDVIDDDEVDYIFNSDVIHYLDDLVVCKRVMKYDDCYKNMLCRNDYEYEFLTHKYVGDKHREKLVLDYWFSKNRSFLYGNDLYPDKLEDQEGRLLTAATFTYVPYSMMAVEGGTELFLATEYARIHNNTLSVLGYEEDEWGTIYDNFSGIGVFGSVVNDTADIGFSAIFLWINQYWFIDYSSYLVYTRCTCIVPTAKLFIGWTTLFPYYTPGLHMAVFFCFIYGTSVLFCIHYYVCRCHRYELMKQSSSYIPLKILGFWTLQTLRIYLQQSFIPVLHWRLVKLIIFFLFVLSLLNSAMFNSSLSTSMTIPEFEDEINTVEDLADSDKVWLGTSAGAWIDSIQDDPSETYVKIVKKFRENDLLNVPASRKIGYAIERLESDDFYGCSNVHCSRDCVCTCCLFNVNGV